MPSFLMEDQFKSEMVASVVVGVDEVGYGAIAGPVVAAAVYFTNREHDYIGDIKDSKMLSPKKRGELFNKIASHAKFGVGFASVAEIEQHNILVASHISMRRALENLNVAVDLVLVDGSRTPDLPWATRAIVKGDSISASIAAASIVAKVTRDRFMQTLHKLHPEYAWDKNCGYGTKAHMLSIKLHGRTAHHRSTFAPIRRLTAEQQERNLAFSTAEALSMEAPRRLVVNNPHAADS
ncbi:ribonuclease HII [Anaplasma capra]|uniref:ribonuclease HII n=1 Tax=Anaplasma capra TaxID=1562740 RepID=UPI0021D59365|nr:ribonuclease HII [Anaplasma capra]MCU7611335.1 ribonuclease HII [Anaplasma capra]MCU7612409.1 ribonuclease HII [Anaplasma capra]